MLRLDKFSGNRLLLSVAAAASLAIACDVAVFATPAPPTAFQKCFALPPPQARPWVYWFWLNGNITREGITADLEAMKKAGIGGALIMEVDQGTPVGNVPFAGPQWRELFKHVLREASRLGLEINMNGDAGWCGSGGPWVTPKNSMKKVVWSEAETKGAGTTHITLRQPESVAGFYRDICVLAIPSVPKGVIEDLPGKTALVRRDVPEKTQYRQLPPESCIGKDNVIRLDGRMTPDGVLTCDLPAGNWTILRLGFTSTGAVNAPAPASGRGLECDKLSEAGADEAFDGLIGRILKDSPVAAGKSLVSMHIDSWEMGSQNWTDLFPQEFERLRGYSIYQWLPVLTGRAVGTLEQSERILWDFRRTIADLVAARYAGHMQQRAKKAGIRLSIEAYGDAVFDDIQYGGMADEPMTEFWSWPGNFTAGIAHQMASSAHVYGKNILGAEAFTAGDGEKWLFHPGSVKPLGDWAFCRGVNRFVFHRFAMQPWVGPGRSPGMSMGPWGLHYERTQTWWPLSSVWHTYLSRCQYMLRLGLPSADILYLEPEGAPRSFSPPDAPERHGFRSDICTPDALFSRVSVKEGQLVLPDGNSYRVLVLPAVRTMTPRLLRRISELARAGVKIIGTRPQVSPGLTGYPRCDEEITEIAAGLWDNRLVHETTDLETELKRMGIEPDFTSDRLLDFTHRSSATQEIYFVSNQGRHAVNARCSFRAAGENAELWNPETGTVTRAASAVRKGKHLQIDLRLEAGGSIFVVIPHSSASAVGSLLALTHTGTNGKTVDLQKPRATAQIHVLKAMWGPAGDAARTIDVTAEVARRAKTGDGSFVVAELAAGGDPAVNVIKTLTVEYLTEGKRLHVTATDPETLQFEMPADGARPIRLEGDAVSGGVRAIVTAPGTYRLGSKRGHTVVLNVKRGAEVQALTSPWRVVFPSGTGAPAAIVMKSLAPLSHSNIEGVRYFSGIATYTTDVQANAGLVAAGKRISLDLGEVEVCARVTINGKPAGTAWHSPYVLDVTGLLKPGKNSIRIEVANLWPNRMIGDEHLPEDSARRPDGTLERWPDWLDAGKMPPTGRYTFTSWRLWKASSPLPLSGLIGPVQLVSEPVIVLRKSGNSKQ